MISLFGADLQRPKKDFQSAIPAATTSKTAASVVIGMSAASGISSRSIIVRVIQCTIPAIGVLPPFLTLAAVRAIAPVAGMPPKSPEKIFPSPCPTSSAFDLCVSPIIPSETTAERSDSIPARIAIVNAGDIICCTSLNDIDGTWNLGKDDESSPYTLPIVLTGSSAK